MTRHVDTRVKWGGTPPEYLQKKDSKAANNECIKKKSTKFTVYIDDNYHYMDESERITGSTFSTAEEAVAECKSIVDGSLRWKRRHAKDKNDPEEIYITYIQFGDDPFIKTDGPDNPKFSAREYARERIKEIVKEDIKDKTLYG